LPFKLCGSSRQERKGVLQSYLLPTREGGCGTEMGLVSAYIA
jgi:hypothetical protein